jgi:hypothetical protein
MHIAAVSRTTRDLDLVTQRLLQHNVPQRLLQHNVKIHSFSRYYLGPQTRAGLIFGYGAVDLPEIRLGLERIRGSFTAP